MTATRGGHPLPNGWFGIRQPPELPPGLESFLDQPYKGSARLRKAKALPAVLPLGDFLAHLVVTKDIAKKLGLKTRTVALSDADGTIAKDYQLVEIEERVPLDRKAAKAAFVNGWLEVLEHASWGERCGPLPKIFRLLERPELIFVERSLADILKKADKKVFIDDYSWAPSQPFPPLWSLAAREKIAKDAKAEDAFWSLRGGKSAARKAALADPWWAYAVAMTIDRKPAKDTRVAASKSPVLASLYATDVDRNADAFTRKAAFANGLAALRYATHLDLAIDPKTRKSILRDAGHDEETLAKEEGFIAEVAQWLKGGVAVAKEKAFSKFEEPTTDRYAGKSKKKSLPKHEPVEAAVRSDIDAFVKRGYARLALKGDPHPQAVADRLAAYLKDVQTGTTVIAKSERSTLKMELGCAWGEQLHRALSWQWANVVFDGGSGIALVAPDRAFAHYPFMGIERALKKGAKNTLPLLFAMLSAGNTPPSSAEAYTTLA